MLALSWHSTPAYYASYYAGIFDTGLVAMIHLCLKNQVYVNICISVVLVITKTTLKVVLVGAFTLVI